MSLMQLSQVTPSPLLLAPPFQICSPQSCLRVFLEGTLDSVSPSLDDPGAWVSTAPAAGGAACTAPRPGDLAFSLSRMVLSRPSCITPVPLSRGCSGVAYNLLSPELARFIAFSPSETWASGRITP